MTIAGTDTNGSGERGTWDGEVCVAALMWVGGGIDDWWDLEETEIGFSWVPLLLWRFSDWVIDSGELMKGMGVCFLEGDGVVNNGV